MLIAFASICTFASVLFLAYSFSARRPDVTQTRLAALAAGRTPRQQTLEQPFMVRAVAPGMRGITGLVLALLPGSWVKRTSQRLVWSGLALTIEGFVMIWMAATIAGGLMGWMWSGMLGSSDVMRIAGTAIGAGVGFIAPQFWLSGRVTSRQYLTRKEFPDVVDLMVTSVEAGLSLDASLQKVTEYHSGPLQAELQRALHNMNLGQSRREAMTSMADRLNLPELRSFVQTLNQAEVTGAPIGQVLRVQAEQVRIKRRQNAEAQAQRAPLLMIVPLVFFIFPSLFIVLLGPAAMTIVDAFNNSEVFGG